MRRSEISPRLRVALVRVVPLLVALVVTSLVGGPGAASALDLHEPTSTGQSSTPAATPTDQPTDRATDLDDAVLRWGMSNEANNAAFAAGTFNFFSAGRIADPGRGNVALTRAGWSQRNGNVAIEKWNGSTHRPATWAGLGTDSSGVTISGPGSGRFSGHQFVFSRGTGSIDPVAGTAHLNWDGDVTVLFYSGYTFFYLADPVLDVADGRGTLTAVLSGFGGTRQNPDAWSAVAPQRVIVAELPVVDFRAESGFNATPAFDGVRTTVDGESVTGSFPQPFVTFMSQLGIAPFWRRSGSASTDDAKKALPITVSFDGAALVDPPEPVSQTPAPVIENEAPDPPVAVTSVGTTTRSTRLPGAALPAAVPQALPIALTSPITTPLTVQLVAAKASTAHAGYRTWAWWIGGGLLVLAALVVVAAFKPLPASRVLV